ncbi:MAG TPA: G1 family glutamic endopeptidase [Streptosporangiaceae bacterium]|nr:G1 family glutamic endopeptidase [Streptosporangiaceae bacterium]
MGVLSTRKFVIASMLPLLGVLAPNSPSGAAPAGTTSSHNPALATRLHALRLADVKLPRTHLPRLTPGAVSYTSNWSGYAVLADPKVQLRFVRADFTIPSVDCSLTRLGTSGYANASSWVGLDGFNGHTVEQAGIDAFCDSSGVAQYDAWYEMYPQPPVVFSGVNPGDAVAVSIYFDSSTATYSLGLTDLTSGGFVAKSGLPCPSGSTCRNASAEVITQDPGAGAPVIDLADYGMTNCTGVRMTSRNGTHGTLSTSPLWKSTEVVMADTANTVMSQPSALYGGQAFSDTWHSSS